MRSAPQRRFARAIARSRATVSGARGGGCAGTAARDFRRQWGSTAKRACFKVDRTPRHGRRAARLCLPGEVLMRLATQQVKTIHLSPIRKKARAILRQPATTAADLWPYQPPTVPVLTSPARL